jgi:hypothetical protein
VGKSTGSFGLLTAMIEDLSILAIFVIRSVNRKW